MKHLTDLLLINTKLCILEISTNPTRSFLTSFGIFLGIASLLINISFIRALNEDIQQNLEKAGGLKIITLKMKTPLNKEDSRNFNRSPGLKMQDAYKIVERFPYTANVLPVKNLNWNRVSANGKATYANINAVDPEYFKVYDLSIQFGEIFSIEDYVKKQKYCLIGKKTAIDLFNDTLSVIGRSLLINNVNFTIKGVIFSEQIYERKARMVFYPYSVYSQRHGENSVIDEIAIQLKSSDFVIKALQDFPVFLKQLHRGIDDIEVLSNVTKLEEMKKASKGINVLLFCIAAISLVVGGISIMNIMFATVGNRIKEIGIRKAIGAKKIDIFIQFIIEAITLCFAGGIPGILVGSLITLFPKGFFPYNPSLMLSDFIIAICFIIITGFLSGFSPSIMAARMQPVHALRF